jgi:serralysin
MQAAPVASVGCVLIGRRHFFCRPHCRNEADHLPEMRMLPAPSLQSWANVANLTFTEVGNAASATFIEHSVPIGFFSTGALGYHFTPDSAAPAHGYFNCDATGWDENNANGGLRIGGFAFETLVHETGHGLGLAHPHDTGGGSTIWPGVTGPFDSYGSNGLDQSVFTVMSYNSGWDAVQDPFGHGLTNYGYAAGPMAFDIAAIQYLYGANMSYHTGSDTYALPDGNGAGTYWSCIWDAGGTDQMVYNGTRNVVIDLTAATIDNTATGGGVLSYADGIYGGLTIANGVVIENASAGSGNDTLTGNDVDNLLFGNGGSDLMFANGGRDTVDGGAGNNTIVGGRDSSDGADSLLGGGGHDFIFGNGGADTVLGGEGNNTLVGGFGVDSVVSGSGADLIWTNQNNDFITAGRRRRYHVGGPRQRHRARRPGQRPDLRQRGQRHADRGHRRRPLCLRGRLRVGPDQRLRVRRGRPPDPAGAKLQPGQFRRRRRAIAPERRRHDRAQRHLGRRVPGGLRGVMPG